ncbi:hypothetical protein [Algimonas arctica]|nr:hypothetical protein [Algimonas arctica]
MTRSQADQWAKSRVKGRWHFVFFNGVLVWGGTSALILSTFLSFLNDQDFARTFMLAAPLSMVGGFIWGLMAWRMTETRYNKFQATQDETS